MSLPRAAFAKGLRAYHEARSALRLGGVPMHGPLGPRIALTFDDGPSPAWTRDILSILRAQKARATFFLLGKHVDENPEIALEIAAEHEIGCHSYGHERSLVDHEATFLADLERCRATWSRVLQQSPALYRFPWGRRGVVTPAIAAREGLRCVHWSASGKEFLDAQTIVRLLRWGLLPGAIVLLHDGLAPHSKRNVPRTATVEALPHILDFIASEGLETVTVSELLDGPRGAR